MILSALLTSVGINLGLCLLFFTLYSILRKQPGNRIVYAPRLVEKEKKSQQADFSLERLLPSPGWVRQAWEPSEDELLSTVGLDAVVFMHIFTFSLKVFTVAGIIGITILLPINFLGNQLSYDFSDLPNKSLDSFSISNVDDGSNRLWIHFCAAYVFTGVVCYFLYQEYSYISSKRVSYFYSSKPQPHQFTLLVRGIPGSSRSSFSEVVESFFKDYHPSTYLSHTVIRRTSKIQELTKDAEKLHRRLARLNSNDNSHKRFRRDGFLGIFGRKVDLLDHYGKRLEALQDNVRMEQSSLAGKEVAAAFVSFNSRYGAAIALHIQQGVNPTEWVTEQAPAPQDVHWPFFSSSFMKRWICKLAVVVACIALTILFLIPVVIVQGLTHLDQLETWFPFLKGVLNLFISRLCCHNASDDLEVPSIPYHSEIPRVIFSVLLGITYFFLAPLILPFLLVYYCLGYIIYRNQLLNVYAPKFETGGKFWPIVHNSTIFSLLLMHVIAIGIFGLKKLPLASSLVIPLPVLTLLFNEYCRKRFLPIFEAYPTECLVKKDREDQNDATMAEFYEKLVTAYQDPALMPVQYSGSSDGRTSPLLHAANV
ncbi:CSC1-like protein HYP1 [Citrus sinensis]|uniref:CSC1-like protein HYP1 n=1 Tax=Citrus sinensis TaxID=2711 RepID=A0ACB8K5M3_CITSI|nr:CSC1-like protein HYP1 [Citrus sinensis]